MELRQLLLWGCEAVTEYRIRVVKDLVLLSVFNPRADDSAQVVMSLEDWDNLRASVERQRERKG